MTLIAIGAFIVGMLLGRVQAQAALEPLFEELRRRVQAAEKNLSELEQGAGPAIEQRLLERMFRE